MFKRIACISLSLIGTAGLGALVVLVRQGRKSPRASAQYVALGSSFAAGIGLGPREPGSAFVCMRSTNGYPQQLARMTGLSLTDMTCSGSTTEHILHGGQVFLGPQLAAIGPDTSLVTITSGGNDVGYIGDLVFASGRGGPLTKLRWKGPRPPEERSFAKVGENLTRIVEDIRRRAPAARVVLVSYPAVLPPEGACEAVNIDPDVADLARTVAARLHEVTRGAAQRSGALFVDMSAASLGHDACSTSPWINGARPAQGTPFHPNIEGATAIAELVLRMISGSDRVAG